LGQPTHLAMKVKGETSMSVTAETPEGIYGAVRLVSTCAIMRPVAECGGELEPDFGGAAQAAVAQKSGSATVPGGAP
jgi:hypothetical protein